MSDVNVLLLIFLGVALVHGWIAYVMGRRIERRKWRRVAHRTFPQSVVSGGETFFVLTEGRFRKMAGDNRIRFNATLPVELRDRPR